MATESNDNTEKVIHFMNQLEQLGLQLKAAGDEQRLTLGRLLALKRKRRQTPRNTPGSRNAARHSRPS